MPTVKVNDINIYYEVYGEGEPLILISALGNDLSGWILQIPDFCKQYQVIAFDNRGVGRTDALNGTCSIEMMTDDTVGLMDTLGIEKAHILGASMGGCIAQELALKNPQRVKSLVLAGSAACLNSWARHVLDVGVRMGQDGLDKETGVRNLLLWLFTDNFFQNRELVEATINRMLGDRNENYEQDRVSAIPLQVNATVEYDARDRLNQITAPTLVIIGKEDIMLPVKLSEELANGIPSAELAVLDGGAHGFYIEIPQKFNNTVLEFLSNVDCA